MNLLIALFACSNSEKNDTQEDTAFTACSATIESTYPILNAADVYYRDSLKVNFSEEDIDATLTLTDSSGAEVSGTGTVEGTQFTFTPAAPLAPSETYRASVEYCGSEEPVVIDFTTSSFGTPLTNGNSDLMGKTFAVDLESGVVLEPAGVGELLRSFLSNTFLINVFETAPETISVLSALSYANSLEQNFCVPTLNDFPLIDVSQTPFFSLETSALQLNVAAYNTKVYNFRVEGTFASDASYFGKAYISGEFDAREAYTLLNDFGFAAENEDDVCELLDGLGASCIECSSDGAPYCLKIVIDDLVANAIEEEIVPVCEVNCHVLCEENLETCDQPQEENTECN